MSRLLPHLRSLLTGPSGRISSSRLMLIVTSTFSMATVAVILHHMLGLHAPEELAAWTSTLQVTGSILAALAGLPYAAGKLTGGLADIVAAIKKGKD